MTNNNMRKISKEELAEILAKHEIFVDSFGEKGTKANLSNTDLTGADLTGANLNYKTN